MYVYLLAAFLVGSTVSQSCPSHTAGYTGTSSLHSSSAGKIYVNEAPSHRAQCNGTVYAWHYCYYDSQQSEDLEVAFGAYEAVFDGNNLDHYEIRPGSYFSTWIPERNVSHVTMSIWRRLNTSRYTVATDLVLV